jgi:predicted dehydrogenase
MIRAAIVGLGWWGRTIAREIATSDVIRPVMGIDPDENSRSGAAAFGMELSTRFEDALSRPDIDALILCSPHKFHADQIVAAAGAGKHVFCEKPLCTTGSEGERALGAVSRAGVTLGIGHERRFEPAVIAMREALARGDYGVPLLMEGNFSQDKFFALPPDNWRLSPVEAPVGPLSATGIHLVDLAIAVFGRPVEVWARLATRGSTFANGDTLSVTLAFESGATATLTAILATPFVGRLAVYGSKGWIEIRDRTHPEKPTGWDVTSVRRGLEPVTAFHPPHPAVRDNLEAFARAAAGVSPYPVTAEEMTHNVRCFEAISRSAASGRIERI